MEVSRVTISAATMLRQQQSLTPKRKRELRHQTIELIKSKPAGTVIKNVEFQALLDMKKDNVKATLYPMINAGIISRFVEKPGCYSYTVNDNPVPLPKELQIRPWLQKKTISPLEQKRINVFEHFKYVIRTNPGRYLDQNDFYSESLGIAHNSTNHYINRMVKDGSITRTQHSRFRNTYTVVGDTEPTNIELTESSTIPTTPELPVAEVSVISSNPSGVHTLGIVAQFARNYCWEKDVTIEEIQAIKAFVTYYEAETKLQ